ERRAASADLTLRKLPHIRENIAIRRDRAQLVDLGPSRFQRSEIGLLTERRTERLLERERPLSELLLARGTLRLIAQICENRILWIERETGAHETLRERRIAGPQRPLGVLRVRARQSRIAQQNIPR